MPSDSLLDVIAGLVKRDGETKKEEKKLAREKAKEEKLKAEQEAEELLKAEEEEPEEDEDEEPVGEPADNQPPADEPPPEEEPEGDVDPALVNAVVDKVTQQLTKIMQDVQDKADAEKFRKGEAKMSGKTEKIDTKPKLEQVRKGRMNFREAIRKSVTGTHLAEGYESVVLGVLEDEGIDGPLGYEPFFEKGTLFVEKGSERAAKKALQQSKDINKVPKIIGEVLEFQEFDGIEDLKKAHSELATTEAVDVDGRRRGFKEALRRLTYEKIQQLKKEGAAEFMAAASAAKKAGKKKFKFGDKEYPVTIKVDIPLKKEDKEWNDILEAWGTFEKTFGKKYAGADKLMNQLGKAIDKGDKSTAKKLMGELDKFVGSAYMKKEENEII